MKYYFSIELDDNIKPIKDKFNKYEILFREISNSQIGKYTPQQYFTIVEEFLDFLENNFEIIKKWSEDYLEKNRSKLWLNYGLDTGNNYCDYWEIGKENLEDLKQMWPFLFDRSEPNYNRFIIDLKEAQNEVLRQRTRQSTTNPNYIPFHSKGCCNSCSCWMLDDLEQWKKEEQDEKKSSKNIFFNISLQKDFFKIAQDDLLNLKDEWVNWIPPKPEITKYSNEIPLKIGETPITIIYNWFKKDFQYLGFCWMFNNNAFDNVWDTVDLIPGFVNSQREKLKKLHELLLNGT